MNLVRGQVEEIQIILHGIAVPQPISQPDDSYETKRQELLRTKLPLLGWWPPGSDLEGWTGARAQLQQPRLSRMSHKRGRGVCEPAALFQPMCASRAGMYHR